MENLETRFNEVAAHRRAPRSAKSGAIGHLVSAIYWRDFDPYVLRPSSAHDTQTFELSFDFFKGLSFRQAGRLIETAEM